MGLTISIGIIWLCTIVLSITGTFLNEIRIFQIISDKGYKININKYLESIKTRNENKTTTNSISLFIPLYNIKVAFDKINENNKNIRDRIEELDRCNALTKMNSSEKKYYLNNDSLFTALKISINNQNKLDNSKVILFDDGSKVYYKANDNYEDIEIIEATGNITTLDKEEIKEKIVNRNTISDWNQIDTYISTFNSLPNEKQKIKVKKIKNS